MNLASIQHHSFMKSAVVDVGVQVGSSLRFDYDLSSSESLTVHLTKRPL